MQVVALHADATYTVHFGDGTNLTGVREACFAAAPAAAKVPTVLAATSMGSCADTVELKVEDMTEPEPDNYFYHRDRSIGLPRTP